MSDDGKLPEIAGASQAQPMDPMENGQPMDGRDV